MYGMDDDGSDVMLLSRNGRAGSGNRTSVEGFRGRFQEGRWVRRGECERGYQQRVLKNGYNERRSDQVDSAFRNRKCQPLEPSPTSCLPLFPFRSLSQLSSLLGKLIPCLRGGLVLEQMRVPVSETSPTFKPGIF